MHASAMTGLPLQMTGRMVTAKFLAATYVRPKTQTASSDGRRYGGFIVRVYFDGELQDSRATPQELITLFPNEDKPALSPNAAPTSRP